MDSKLIKAILVLAIISVLGLGSTVFAEQEGNVAQAEDTGVAQVEDTGLANTGSSLDKFKIRKPTYTYKSVGGRDPFRSLIQTVEEAATTADNPSKERSPVEKYNISQLKLIAVVSAGSEAFALVVLPDGKSYTIREGMKVGLHGGVVKEIRSDQVIVDVDYEDHKGKIKTEEVFLKLRQEGDK